MTYDPKTKTWDWRAGYDEAKAKYQTEIDKLRNENADLRQLLKTISTRLQVAGGAFPTLIEAIRAKDIA